MCCKCCSVKQKKIWVFSIGSLLSVIGILLITLWPPMATKLIRSRLPLTPTSYIFDNWVVTPVPIYTNFYLYNWTNPQEVSNPLIKPHFEELGPYAFRSVKTKEDLIWHDENSTVTFFDRQTWYFDPARSNGSLDDLVTTPHFPTVAAARITRNMHKILRKVVNFCMNREGGALTMTHTAIEWMFHGFYDDFLDFVERLHSPLLPIYYNEFAWLYGRNESKEAEGTFTIHTGKADLSQLGDLKLWNGSNKTGYWDGDCGKTNGSTGELWVPGRSWDESISIFISYAARFINLFPKEKVNFRGVESWRYDSTDQTFDSGYIAEDTKCFCVKGRECPRNGVIDFSPVAFGAPIYLSHPHFYMADPMYLKNTTGMSPMAQTHGTSALIEPTLGVPLEVLGQVLISIHVEQDEQIDYLKDVAHNFYAPLFVIQLEADITDDLLRLVKFALNVPAIGQYIGIGLLVTGAAMVAIGIWLTMNGRWSNVKRIHEESTRSNYEPSHGRKINKK